MQLVAAPCHLRQLVAQVGIVVRYAVDRLGNALAIGIVAVGDAAAALAHGRQLTAMLPGIRPRAVVQGVAYGIVCDGLPVDTPSAGPANQRCRRHRCCLLSGRGRLLTATSVSRDDYSLWSGSWSP